MRWGCFDRQTDGLQHAVEIIKHFVVPKPDDAIAITRYLRVASGVRLHPFATLSAIKFDHELSRRTGEVGDTSSDRVLPAKLPGHDPLAQRPPQYSFDVSSISA